MFFVVTVFTQIVVLNMLIAIMSDTFDRVIENQAHAKLNSQVKVLSDYVFLLPKEAEKFIYLAIPKETDGDINVQWEGKITEIRKLMKSDTKKVIA